MSPRWRRRAVIVAALVGAIALVRVTLLRKDPVPVTVFRVAAGRVEETVTNSKAGTVKTRRRAALSPEIGGRVESLTVRKGVRVKYQRSGVVRKSYLPARTSASIAVRSSLACANEYARSTRSWTSNSDAAGPPACVSSTSTSMYPSRR